MHTFNGMDFRRRVGKSRLYEDEYEVQRELCSIGGPSEGTKGQLTMRIFTSIEGFVRVI